MDDSGVRSYLNISSAEIEDGGLYCCSIQGPNPSGVVSDSIQLEPDAKSSLQHCARLNVYGRLAVFFCQQYREINK